ncbi:hemin uptake protein HemP [Dechloromonas sp. ZY10]|uniref:hemin uptake protein HemP n=1 Tax=Dechloromonas aquae TaxID=2664436 RepID=UPI0035275E88
MLQTPSTPSQPVRTEASDSKTCIDSRQLLAGRNLIEIEHAGQRYQLRVTRENKLILTK